MEHHLRRRGGAVLPDPRETSRLCCQLRMSPALDGIVVHLPAEQV